MKAKAILLCLGLISIALGAQDSIRFSRHLTQGDTDNYKMHISGTMQQGDIDFTMKMQQLVAKVYDNGDADLTTTISDFHLTMGGNEMPIPAPPPSTVKVDKNGMPKEIPAGPQGRMQFLRYMSSLFDKDIKVGDTVNVNTTDPKDPKNKTTGTIKLDSVTDGMAKLTGDITTTMSDADAPAKVHMTMYVNVATSKMSKLEGTVDAMPVAQGMSMSDVKISMERLTS
ncbi:MAG TPA: hypothetical protein VGL56_03930 [Fimbriimonadaceae bacterium]|jgi:hypothetical protein